VPDREKVFDAFRNCITEPKCKDCPWEQCEQFNQKKVSIPVTLALDVLNLLKEQEPLEPTMVKREQSGPLYHLCYCQKCGHHVGNMIKNKVADMHENFCSRCGQAVKWNG
jgi:hypothetical protein